MAEAVLSETERSLLDEHGFVVLEDAIAADQADALRDRSMALAEQERAASGRHVYLGDTAQRVWNLVDKGEVFEQAIQHPRVLGAMTYLLGPDCTLSSFTVNVIGPGAPAGDLHVDHPLGTLPAPLPGFPLSANSIWFLDDFTIENGGHAVCSRQSPAARSATGAGRSLRRRGADHRRQGLRDDHERSAVARFVRQPHRSRARVPARLLLPRVPEAAAGSDPDRLR